MCVCACSIGEPLQLATLYYTQYGVRYIFMDADNEVTIFLETGCICLSSGLMGS